MKIKQEFRLNIVQAELPDLLMETIDFSSMRNIHNTSLYTVLWIKEGNIKLEISGHQHKISAPSMVFLSQFQPYRIQGYSPSTNGLIIQFSSDFYCIHLHQQEVACNGVLFNTVFDPPNFSLSGEKSNALQSALLQFVEEFERPEKDGEMLFTLMKVVFKQAVRLRENEETNLNATSIVHPEISKLKELLEQTFRNRLAPSDYAEKLSTSVGRLNKLVKSQTGLTLSAIIQERIVAEAKKELYLTNKSVKEIALELGFDDPFYFSRLFKNVSDVSPETYRTKTMMRANPSHL